MCCAYILILLADFSNCGHCSVYGAPNVTAKKKFVVTLYPNWGSSVVLSEKFARQLKSSKVK